MSMSLAEIPLGRAATIMSVGGPRGFRRRLLEMGLVPGVEVRIVSVAPLGDPMQIEVRGGQWSIRRNEAAQIAVSTMPTSLGHPRGETSPRDSKRPAHEPPRSEAARVVTATPLPRST